MIHISECSVGEIRLLTCILQILPNENDIFVYLGNTAAAIEALPSRLQKPNLITRIFQNYAKPRAQLCGIHQDLHPKIVASVFTLIALEAGTHLNNLASRADLLSDDQIEMIRRLRHLHILWLEEGVYKMTFGEEVSVQSKWVYQADQCEACIIARFASDVQTIYDLRCACQSRINRKMVSKGIEPRLKIWLDLWFDRFRDSLGAKDFSTFLARNETEATALKAIKKKLWHEKHPKGQKQRVADQPDAVRVPAPVPAPASSPSRRPSSRRTERTERSERPPANFRKASSMDTEAKYDGMLDLLDHYAELRESSAPNEFSAIPASRRPGPSAQAPRAATPASSVYDNNTMRNNSRVAKEGDTFVPPRAAWTQKSVWDDAPVPRSTIVERIFNSSAKTPVPPVPNIPGLFNHSPNPGPRLENLRPPPPPHSRAPLSPRRGQAARPAAPEGNPAADAVHESRREPGREIYREPRRESGRDMRESRHPHFESPNTGGSSDHSNRDGGRNSIRATAWSNLY
jgi:hypothetical protein